MIVTPNTKTVTTYTIELDEDDAAECLSVPYEFADHCAALLRVAGVKMPANGGGIDAVATPARKANARKTTSRKAAKVARPKVKGVNCPECGKTLKTQGFLDRHLRQKHGAAGATTASGQSPAAAPAAA